VQLTGWLGYRRQGKEGTGYGEVRVKGIPYGGCIEDCPVSQ